MPLSCRCGNQLPSTCAQGSSVSPSLAGSKGRLAGTQYLHSLESAFTNHIFGLHSRSGVEGESATAAARQETSLGTYPSPMLLWAVLSNVLIHSRQLCLCRCHIAYRDVSANCCRAQYRAKDRLLQSMQLLGEHKSVSPN